MKPYRNIVVIGDTMLDRITRCEKIKPLETGKGYVGRVLEKSHITPCTPGGAGNVAIGIVRLKNRGATLICPAFPGVYSNSCVTTPLWDRLLVCTDKINSSVISKNRVFIDDEEVCRIDTEYKHQHYSQAYLRNFAGRVDAIDKDTLVVVSDYNKGFIGRRIIEELLESGATVIVDPKNPDLSIYKGVHYITPNESEFFRLGAGNGYQPSHHTIYTADDELARWQQALPGTDIIVTRGSLGVAYTPSSCKRIKASIWYPSMKVKAIDTCGAGDSFLVGLAHALSDGDRINVAIKKGIRTAGYAVTQPGTASFTMDEVDAYYSEMEEADGEDVS